VGAITLLATLHVPLPDLFPQRTGRSVANWGVWIRRSPPPSDRHVTSVRLPDGPTVFKQPARAPRLGGLRPVTNH
jgi:hypothetical protein